MIEIEIDGKTIEATEGSMLIEAADAAGIYIPRFCYHKKLSIAANCRMCLVEVEKSGKPLPACATPITAGMVVRTQSEKAREAQKSVMEFLLINHPLDCPICDQGGECELQDLSMGYGADSSRYTQGKRSIKDKNLGPLISTDMTRCIYCTRCIRFAQEVAGVPELGATGRGEHQEVGTYVEQSLTSEMSGNVIDLCPVGALTSKPYRFTARTWEMLQSPSIAPHDCIGSNIHVHTRGKYYANEHAVMRVVPRENEAVNETWISNRDRFSYEGLHSEDRLTAPMVKQNGEWQAVDWETALIVAADGVRAVKDAFTGEQVGALISPNVTLEEAYLLQKLMRGLGSHNVDHRVRRADFSLQEAAPTFPNLGMPLAELANLDAALLVGSNVRAEQPIAAHLLRKASLKGAAILSVNPVAYDWNFELARDAVVSSMHMAATLAGIAKALSGLSDVTLPKEAVSALSSVKPTEQEQAMAVALHEAENTVVILGATALQHVQATTLSMFAQLISQLSTATFGCLSQGANAAGAWIAGAVPHRTAMGETVDKPGLHAQAMMSERLKAYILVNVEPELDFAHAGAAMRSLNEADCVVCCTPYVTDAMREYATVLLPIAPFAETPGTFVNVEGRWQSFNACSNPLEQVRPGWKVLRVLGNFLDVDGFEYESSQAIRNELSEAFHAITVNTEQTWSCPALNTDASKDLHRVTEWPMYCEDNLVRRATALQATMAEQVMGVHMHSELAAKLSATEGQAVKVLQGKDAVHLPVVIDDRLTVQDVLLPAGVAETAGFGAAFGPIELRVE